MASDDQPNLVRRERIAGISRQARNNCSADSEMLFMMTGGIMRLRSLLSGRDELPASQGQGIDSGGIGKEMF